MLQYLVFVGAAVSIYGASFYIRDTLKGKTQPNRVSWLFWAIAPIIGSVAAFSAGARLVVLPVLITGLIPLTVFIVSFFNPKAYWKLGLLDYFCGACALLALILWGITQDPTIAIIFAITSDGFAAVPTIIKSWKFPETESGMIYATALLNALTTFAAIQTWAFSEYAFGVYFIIVTSILSLFVYRRRIFGRERDLPAGGSL